MPTESNFTKQVQIDGKDVTLEILDTAGQEEFRAFRDASLRQGDGYLLVYSIDDRTSFEEVLKTFTYVTRGNEGRQYKVMVIGNKSVSAVVTVSLYTMLMRMLAMQDLESDRKVSTQEAAGWATQNKIAHMETSAKVDSYCWFLVLFSHRHYLPTFLPTYLVQSKHRVVV